MSAIVLANLCVSYIMTSQNEEVRDFYFSFQTSPFTLIVLLHSQIFFLVVQAEELMRKIEKEEEQLAYEEPDKKMFHLSIVNLVIG